MWMWRCLRLLMFGIYGFLAQSWFDWGIENPKFWVMMLIMLLVGIFASEEEEEKYK